MNYKQFAVENARLQAGSFRYYDLPPIAIEAVLAFDRTGKMQPFAFDIEET